MYRMLKCLIGIRGSSFFIVFYLITGCVPRDSTPTKNITNAWPLNVPEQSIYNLDKLAQLLALKHNMKVRSIEILPNIYHPTDTPGAIVNFLGKEVETRTFETGVQIITNSNWSARSEMHSGGKSWIEYPSNLGPASTKWIAVGEMSKGKSIQTNINNREIYVTIGDDIKGSTALLYMDQFVEWTKSAPGEFKFPIEKISAIYFDRSHDSFKERQRINFDFGEDLKSIVYRFDLAGTRLSYFDMQEIRY